MIHQDFEANAFSDAVLLVGSMISADRTTGLPSGMAVSNWIIDRLVDPTLDAAPTRLGLTGRSRSIVKEIARETPFEVVLQQYPDPDFCRDRLVDTYGQGSPNRYHKAVAKAIAAGHFSHVITTNYDTLIEREATALKTIIEERDRRTVDPKVDKILFKIHGCATIPTSVVYRLSQEGMLEPWKQDFLLETINGRDLVVIGYSGRDFDICPILFRSNYKRLIWLFRDDDPTKEMAGGNVSQNLNHVFDDPGRYPNVYASGGGFDRFFAPFKTPNENFSMSWDEPDLVKNLFALEANKPDEFWMWRAAVFNAIACPGGMSAALGQLSSAGAATPHALELRASLLERVGLYRQSNEYIRRARNSISRSASPEEWLNSLYVEAGRFYTAGDLTRFLKARANYVRTEVELDDAGIGHDKPLHDARKIYLDVLAEKSVRQLSIAAGLVRRRLKLRLDPAAINAAAQVRYTRGEWQDLSLLRVAARDVGIDVQVGAKAHGGVDVDRLLSELDGFAQLNNVVGRVSTYRRSKIKDAATCHDLLEKLAVLGHYGEFWKAFQSFGPSLSDRHYRTYRTLCAFSFLGCEYSLPMKLAKGLPLWWRLRTMDRERAKIVPSRF